MKDSRYGTSSTSFLALRKRKKRVYKAHSLECTWINRKYKTVMLSPSEVSNEEVAPVILVEREGLGFGIGTAISSFVGLTA